MIIINQSFIQLFALVLLTISKKNYEFYIVYIEKPSLIFKFFLKFLNFITSNKYYFKNIYFFRDQFCGISDQEIHNRIDRFHSRVFYKNQRLGGQIFIENSLRTFNMKYFAFDMIFRHFYFEYQSHNNKKEIANIFRILNSIRLKEKTIYNRIMSLKSALDFSLLFFKNIINNKLDKIFGDKSRDRFLNQSSFAIHDFNINKEFQKQDLIIDVIKFLSKELNYEKVINEKEFLYFISLKIANRKRVFNLKKIYFLYVELIFNFFTSNLFLQKCSYFIDTLVSTLLEDIFLPKKFKLLSIDPIQGKSIPILSELKLQGYDISFSSFSTGSFYTKSFSDYNGPFKTIFSQSKGFTEIVKKSSFKGKIIEIDCFLSLFNNSKSMINKSYDKNKSTIKVIVPENQALWSQEFSNKEYEDFSKIINELNTQQKIEICVKKKKKYSLIENYLTNNYPNHTIPFKSPIRGYMGDFINQDFVLSIGLSSLGEKASNNFGLKYIIFDKSERSKNQWENFYSNSKLKPFFAKDIKDIEKILYEK